MALEGRDGGRDGLGTGVGLGAFKLMRLVRAVSAGAEARESRLLGRLALGAGLGGGGGGWARTMTFVGLTNIP